MEPEAAGGAARHPRHPPGHHPFPVNAGHRRLVRGLSRRRIRARTVIFSLSGSDPDLLRDVRARTLRTGAAFKVLPTTSRRRCAGNWIGSEVVCREAWSAVPFADP